MTDAQVLDAAIRAMLDIAPPAPSPPKLFCKYCSVFYLSTERHSCPGSDYERISMLARRRP